MSLYFTIQSSILIAISVPVHLVLLITLFKFRHKAPFTSAFFKISFHLGLFDIIHIFNDWVIGMLPYLGLNGMIIRYQGIFAKQFSLIWWYSALAQKLSILFLAVDRVATIWFNHNITEQQLKLLIAFNWLIPGALTAPQAFVEFGYHTFNESHAVILYWDNPHHVSLQFQWVNSICCTCYCVVISLACGISYVMAFYKVYKNKMANTSAAAAEKVKIEAKLAIAGFIHFCLTFACGIICSSLVAIDVDYKNLMFMTGWQQLLFDVYCCIHPHLILGCSKVTRNHVKAMLMRKPPETFENKIFVISRMALQMQNATNRRRWGQTDQTMKNEL